MARKGRKFELAYADLYKLDKTKYKVISPGFVLDKITGVKREVDVLIIFKDSDENDRKIAVECRDRKAGEDIKSIEQLIQKKEDMEVDYLVISTLYKFTPNAIKKAKYYGIIIETAEMITKGSIENLEKDFFYDVFYIIPKLNKLHFLLSDKSIVDFKSLNGNLNLLEKYELKRALDLLLLSNFSFSDILEKVGVQQNDFFKYDNNYWSCFNNIINLGNDCPDIFKRLRIITISYIINIKPYRLSLPINRSLSIFEVENKKNKAFKVVFGNDEDNVTIGYLNDKEIIAKVHLKSRQFHRVVGGNMCVNTIFPKDAEVHVDIDDIELIAVNTLDYSDVS